MTIATLTPGSLDTPLFKRDFLHTATRLMLFNERICDVKLCAKSESQEHDHPCSLARKHIVRDNGGNKDETEKTGSKMKEGQELVPVTVPAVTAMLAARSPVFHRMFGESEVQHGYGVNAPIIWLEDVSTDEIRTIVRFCHTDEIVVGDHGKEESLSPRPGSSTEEELRMFVKLLVPAHYFQMKCLQHALFKKIGVELEAHWKARRYYVVAVLFDAAFEPSVKVVFCSLYQCLLRMIAIYPVPILCPNTEATETEENSESAVFGGVVRLGAPALKAILGAKSIRASEMKLFEILQEWVACTSMDCTDRFRAEKKRKLPNMCKGENPVPAKKMATSDAKIANMNEKKKNEEKDCLESDGKDNVLRDLVGCIDLKKLKPSTLNDSALRESYGLTEAELLAAFKAQAEAMEANGKTQHALCSELRGLKSREAVGDYYLVVGAEVPEANRAYLRKESVDLESVDQLVDPVVINFKGKHGSMNLLRKTDSFSTEQQWYIEFTERGRMLGTGTNIYKVAAAASNRPPRKAWIVDPFFLEESVEAAWHLTPIGIYLAEPWYRVVK